ncbi:DUF1152 domain-containing protein [Streptomyces sp. NPDC020875]|uniref:DUF1152 domain-containing protein n=1 Tax=Streptomyces sp. NPDC020875 TaxID=3154898 RepID=UPI0033FD1355
MVDAALYGSGNPAIVLTYAWDRLLIDPLPGPRSPADFTGLTTLTPNVFVVTAESRPVPPADSTLPRLALEVRQTIGLIDPRYGAEGVLRQLTEVVELLRPESIDRLDVGGDILAWGDEATLRSPLADALVLAACPRLDADVRLLLAGPGLDGELTVGELYPLLGRNVLTLSPDDVGGAGVLERRPSEAAAMLAATARGVRGRCEVRDAGLPVPLTDEGSTVHADDPAVAFARSTLARTVARTRTLTEAETLSCETIGFSEIDYECTKASRLRSAPVRPLDRGDVLDRVTDFEQGVRARQISHTTVRRMTEALGLPGEHREPLKALLIRYRPGQYVAPLWLICRGGRRRVEFRGTAAGRGWGVVGSGTRAEVPPRVRGVAPEGCPCRRDPRTRGVECRSAWSRPQSREPTTEVCHCPQLHAKQAHFDACATRSRMD